MTGDNNLVVDGAITGTTARLTLEEGNRIGLVTTGTLSALADLQVTVELKYDPA